MKNHYPSRHILPLLLLAATTFTTNQLSAQCRVLPSSNSFKVNGSAKLLQDNEYRLTEALPDQSGSIWFGNYLNLDSDFNLEFEIYLGTSDGGADGLAFVLQQSPEGTAAKSIGGGLGYRGITPSVEVEYDTWQNPNYNDPGGDHIALNRNGDVIHNGPGEVVAPVTVSNMEDGKYHATRIEWTAATHTLRVYWNGEASPRIEKVFDMKNLVFGDNPYVYWGWTGSTGGQNNVQKVKMQHVQFIQVLGVTGATKPSSCSGATGSVDVSVQGGIPPFSFAWTHGALTEDLAGVSAGQYTVYVTDACGNSGDATFTVGSTAAAPTIHCPQNIVVDNTPGVCGNNSVTFDYPTVTGGCPGAQVTQVTGYPGGSFFDMGTTTNTFVVIGPDGSSSQCTFTVTVR